MLIDIRDQAFAEVDQIMFDDEDRMSSHAYVLKQGRAGVVAIWDDQGDYVEITCEQHAVHLIMALQKAIELKWLK